MDKVYCGDCKHFRQHYIKFTKSRYDPISDGHCVYPRLKRRRTDDKGCVNFKAENIK